MTGAAADRGFTFGSSLSMAAVSISHANERPAAINTLHSGVTLSSVSTSASNDSTTDTAPPYVNNEHNGRIILLFLRQ